MKKLSSLLLVLCAILSGCSSSVICPAGSIDPQPAGPVLTISSVRDQQSREKIPNFTVRDIRLNDVPLTGVASLLCHQSCGFGADAGTYTFTISAPAKRDTTLTVEAHYHFVPTPGHEDDACPSGGTLQGEQVQLLL